MDWVHSKGLLWLYFWCQVFFPSFLCWKHVHILISEINMSHFLRIPLELPQNLKSPPDHKKFFEKKNIREIKIYASFEQINT